jgi:thiamine monophosphate synthase
MRDAESTVATCYTPRPSEQSQQPIRIAARQRFVNEMTSNDARERLRGLYVIVDPEHTGGRTSVEITKAALDGGAIVIQLRDKVSDKGPMLEAAIAISNLCKQAGALFFMNDHAEVLSPGQLIGTSNHAMQEAQVSISDQVDYVAVGAIYGTATKEVTVSAGLETLREIRGRIDSPIAAIGGINASNIGPVIEAGAEMACVISAVGLASDPEAATRELVQLIR